MENIQVGEVGLRLVQVIAIGTTPAERLALRPLQATSVDVVLAEDLLLLSAEVFSDHGHDSHLCEVARRQRKISGRAAQNILHAARGRSDVIESN